MVMGEGYSKDVWRREEQSSKKEGRRENATSALQVFCVLPLLAATRRAHGGSETEVKQG